MKTNQTKTAQFYDNLISLLNKEIENKDLRELAILYIDNIIEENKKVLKIIRNKFVDMTLLLICKTVEDYNEKTMWKYFVQKLTKEEFDLLKEVFDNE